jgi:hypothetical protein
VHFAAPELDDDMSRRHLRFIMLALGLTAAIVAAVVLLFTYGVRDAIAFVGIAAMLALAYLVRRRARARLLYTDDKAGTPASPPTLPTAGRETETSPDLARSNGHRDHAPVSQRDRNA